MTEDRSVELFGLACGAVANQMDEEGLSKVDALKSLFAILLAPHIPSAVRDAITDLEKSRDEPELFRRLSKEAHRASKKKKQTPVAPAWPNGLFD